MRLRVSGATDVGMARKRNEDCYDIDVESQLYVVADGMGGHSHGEIASKIAVDTIRDYVLGGGSTGGDNGNERTGPIPIQYDDHQEHSNLLANAVRHAHKEVLRAIHQDSSLQGMGTTVVGLLVKGTTAAFAHVGDSRAYRLRHGAFEQLTQDHTWVHEQVQAGYLSEEQARHHPLKNVVTRALGSDKDVVVDLQEVMVQAGDLYVICSDGLTTMLEDAEIKDIVQLGDSLDDSCRRLIDEANVRGGLDNVTVILVHADDGSVDAGDDDETADITDQIEMADVLPGDPTPSEDDTDTQGLPVDGAGSETKS